MFESPELAKGTIVLTVELKKSWARTPTYWVSLVSVPTGPLTLWYAVRHWKFRRREDNQEVKGESLSERQLSIKRGLMVVESLLQTKLNDADYVVHNLKIEAPVRDDLKPDVDAFCATLQKMLPSAAQRLVSNGVEVIFPELNKEATESEDQASAFAAAVKRRKREAKW